MAISPEDAVDLIDFINRPSNVAICHKTEGTKHESHCRGALLFQAGGDARVFAGAKEMIDSPGGTSKLDRHGVYGLA